MRHLALAVRSAADQVEALVNGKSVGDVFARIEAADEVRRIDPSEHPGAYHCATVSMLELRSCDGSATSCGSAASRASPSID